MKHIFTLCALLIICSSVAAVGIDGPSTVYLYEDEKQVVVTINNEESFSQDFEIEAICPTAVGLSKEQGTIAGNSGTNVTFTIQPNTSLVGQTYEGRIEVILGDRKFVKNMRLVFRAEQKQEEKKENENEYNGFSGLFLLPASILTLEFAVNVLLVFIAAVLLIAFIARFVKRLEGK